MLAAVDAEWLEWVSNNKSGRLSEFLSYQVDLLWNNLHRCVDVP
jgi:hypothetical protein